MAEEKREEASEPEVPVMDQVGNVMSSMKHLMVSALAHANYGLNSLKSTFVTVSSFDQHEERVLSPVTDLKLNIEQSVLGVSKSINDTYPFLSSMAKAHQWNVRRRWASGAVSLPLWPSRVSLRDESGSFSQSVSSRLLIRIVRAN
jgi:hypothetical protein